MAKMLVKYGGIKMTYVESLKKFDDLLDLKRQIVGIYFFENETEYNQFVAPVCQKLLPYCVTVRNASEGQGTKMTVENFACPASAVALGLIQEDDYSQSGEKHANMKVYKNLCVSRSVAEDMVYCQKRIFGVGVVPAKDWDGNPDMVIIVTNPANAMRILQGHAYHSGQLKEIKMAGMQAICQECTSYPYEKDQINISMMCSGTRHVGRWGEDEMGLGIPYSQFAKVADGIEQTLNPMENSQNKKKILDKLKIENRENDYKVNRKENYYRGAYQGIKNRNNSSGA